MTFDLSRTEDRTTEPTDAQVLMGIPANGAPFTVSWRRLKGWITSGIRQLPVFPNAGSRDGKIPTLLKGGTTRAAAARTTWRGREWP